MRLMGRSRLLVILVVSFGIKLECLRLWSLGQKVMEDFTAQILRGTALIIQIELG
jgi:hypothetical protein